MVGFGFQGGEARSVREILLFSHDEKLHMEAIVLVRLWVVFYQRCWCGCVPLPVQV